MNILALLMTLAAVLALAATSLYRKYLLKSGAFTEKELLVGQSTIAAIMCALFLITAGPWWNTFAPHARLLVPASRRLRKATVCVSSWGKNMLVTSARCISSLEKAGMIVEISHVVADHE